MTINHEQEQFQLEPAPVGLMTLATAAKSFGVTRQAFHRWNVQPVRVDGTRRLFDMASVLRNRLDHAEQADRTVEDAELDRYQARIDLLTEQIEHQRLRNQAQRQRYAHHDVGEWAVRCSLDTAARIIEDIPSRVLSVTDKIAGAEPLLREETRKAAGMLRAAEIKPHQDAGNGEVDA